MVLLVTLHRNLVFLGAVLLVTLDWNKGFPLVVLLVTLHWNLVFLCALLCAVLVNAVSSSSGQNDDDHPHGHHCPHGCCFSLTPAGLFLILRNWTITSIVSRWNGDLPSPSPFTLP